METLDQKIKKSNLEKNVLTFENIPDEVLQIFEGWNRVFKSPDEVKEKDFIPLFTIKHPEYTTYVWEKTIHYRKRKDLPVHTTETETMFLNINNDGEDIGDGKIGFMVPVEESGFIYNKPFVKMIKNKSIDFDGQNSKKEIATQTLLEMNEYSKEKYGIPLYSGETRTDEGNNLFSRLAAKGVVDEVYYQDDNKDKMMYRFK